MSYDPNRSVSCSMVILVLVLSRLINLAIVGLVGVILFLLLGDLGSSLESDLFKAKLDTDSKFYEVYSSGKLFYKSIT